MADSQPPAEAPPKQENEQKPAGEGGEGEGEGPSKKALKKAEAKAKKEAEKAKRAAERMAADAAKQAAPTEDLAKDNYGNVENPSIDAPWVAVEDIKGEHADSGKPVKVRAFLQNVRMQGAKMAFVELRSRLDWSVQGVVVATPEGKPVSRPMVKWVGGLSAEGYVIVEALVKRAPEPIKSCRVHDFELHITKFFCAAPAPEVLAVQLASANRSKFEADETPKSAEDQAADAVEKLNVSGAQDAVPSASLNTLLDNPAMRMRAPVSQAIFEVRGQIKKLFREYLDSKGFKEFEPPCLIPEASEGGAEVFTIPYFEKNAYLAQSPQLYKQYQIAGGRDRVYCLPPVFRAENSNTPRHMTEFTGLDLEMAIKDDYREVLDVLEGVLLYIFRGLKERCADEIELVRSAYPCEEFQIPEPGKEVRLTFAEAQQLLREEGPEEFRHVSDDEDMSTPQEKALGAVIRNKYKTDFYALDKFPEGARPFYAMEDPTNPKVTNAYDFFMRGQEILSGGQRLHVPEQLEARIRRKGMDPKGHKTYIDVFRSVGCPPHGGGGMGLDRITAFYLNLPSIHHAAYFPRTPIRLGP